MPAPALDQDVSLAERCEDFSIQQLVAQLRIEALIVAILPRAAGLDIEGLHIERDAKKDEHRREPVNIE